LSHANIGKRKPYARRRDKISMTQKALMDDKAALRLNNPPGIILRDSTALAQGAQNIFVHNMWYELI
jgi:hypothetical protein